VILPIVIVFTVLTMLSVPIAVSSGLAVAIGLAFFSRFPLVAMFQNMVTGIDNFVLVAIPLFILTGNLMNAGGITDRIFTFVRRLVGHVSGGLAHANVGASVIFSGMSGSAVADAGGLGAVEIKAMRDQGYPPDFAAAVTAASSTIGPIIPPSIPFIIYGAIAEVSVGRLFVAGFVPGVALALSMVVMIVVLDRIYHFPRDPRASLREVLRAGGRAALAMLTPVIILTGLLGGVFTPTEAGAIAVAYAFVISFFVYRTIGLRDLPRILVESMITTAIVTFIISNVTPLSWVLVMERAGDAFVAFVQAHITSVAMVLLAINILLLLMGAVIEAGAVLILMTPILLPLMISLGIDPVHFGVIIVLNLMIGVATPPIGMSLFVVSHVARTPVESVMRAVLPFLIPLIIVLLLVTYVPSLSLFLPSLVFG
jgi:tripartite ATP-independent transporter DctM subunit